MSIDVHYLLSYLNRLPDNPGDLSEEQGERFRQDNRREVLGSMGPSHDVRLLLDSYA